MNGQDQRLKVFIVDDSPLMCRAMKQILDEDPEIEVVGRALNGQEAIKRLGETKCDVCTLDVHMPGMNGLSVLKRIMVRNPIPTVMVSAFTADGSRVTFEALRYGAVDFFQKPSRNEGENIQEQGELLRAKIKRAARVKVQAARYLRLKVVEETRSSQDEEPSGVAIIAASTGGYASILSLLPAMPPPKIPVVVSLGTPSKFLKAFVDYIRPFLSFPVHLLEDGQLLLPGAAYFVSNEDASSMDTKDGRTVLRISKRVIPVQDELHGGLDSHGPDKESGLDLLMFSASEHFGPKTLAVFLSGDRLDGLTGAQEVERNGGMVLVQRPETCLCPDQINFVTEKVQATKLSIPELAKQIGAWS